MSKTHHITCIIWITIGLMAVAIQAGPVDENEIKKGRDCKTFCDRCGCMGFYCGEECICECNQEKTGGDTECISAIQANAKENKTPYEILIQGPSSNRFLKNAFQFDQNQQTCSPSEYGRTKRSTVVIYKPATEGTPDFDGFCERPLTEEDDAQLRKTFRGKRSVIDVQSWFTDFTNTVVKPAPLPVMSDDADTDAETDNDADPEEFEETIEETEESGQENRPVSSTNNESIIPALREIRKDIKNALNIGENESIVRGFRKTFNKLGNGAVKKIRGTISNFLPLEEEANNNLSRKFINRIKERILQPFGDEEPLES